MASTEWLVSAVPATNYATCRGSPRSSAVFAQSRDLFARLAAAVLILKTETHTGGHVPRSVRLHSALHPVLTTLYSE